ncbi:MAG: GIY-YIG nuclease family protein [Desulfovibrio sp.]|jgi:putative endonuclease|nr:GIY-YIG nuclease family protein [Desulfovibrio sp.]
MNEAVGEWKVYLLECSDGSLYCGSTNNLERRMAQHNGVIPGGARYTSRRRPVFLLGTLDCPDRSSALRTEIFVKRQPRKAKLEFLTHLTALGSWATSTSS